MKICVIGAGPSENLLCRLGLPRALAAGDRASREKPLLLLRAGGGPRGGGEKPVPLRIWYVSKGPISGESYRAPMQATQCHVFHNGCAFLGA